MDAAGRFPLNREPPRSAASPFIEFRVTATARFPDGRSITIEGRNINDAHLAIWRAVSRESGASEFTLF